MAALLLHGVLLAPRVEVYPRNAVQCVEVYHWPRCLGSFPLVPCQTAYRSLPLDPVSGDLPLVPCFEVYHWPRCLWSSHWFPCGCDRACHYRSLLSHAQPGSAPPPRPASAACSPAPRWGGGGGGVTTGATGAPGGRQGATWQRYCSTPTTLTKDSVAAGLAFSSVQQPQTEERGRWGSPSLSRAAAPPAHLLAYDPDLGRTADSAGGDGELAFPALVVRRLSLGESGRLRSRDPPGPPWTLGQGVLFCLHLQLLV